MRSVAVYARVSTEHEAQLAALDNQIQYYDKLLAEHSDWKLYDRYIDEGITGTSTQKRKNFMRMINDAQNGCFDLIITREVSRFARNTVDTLQETRKLKKIGVEVWFTEDNIWTMNDEDGELRLTIMATLAQNESKKTSLRVKAGQMISFQNAVPYGNGNILGYDRVGREYVVNPEQAKTVRTIFQLYLSGMGVRTIQYELEKRGYKTAYGHTRWFTTVISHVLRNPFYCGTIVYRKQYVPDYLDQKKKNNNGEVEQVVVEGKHEPLISKEDFFRTQEKLEKRKAGKAANQASLRPVKSVWSTKLVCDCGSSFQRAKWGKNKDGTTRYGFQCYRKLRTGSVSARLKKGLSIEGICDVPMIQQWKLELMAGMIFRMMWGDKELIKKTAEELLGSNVDKNHNPQQSNFEADEKRSRLAAIEKKLDNLLELRLEGDIDPEKYREKKAVLEKQKEELLEDLKEDVVTKEEHQVIKDRIEILKYALQQNFDFDSYNLPDSVIDAFVEKIVVRKDMFEWHLKVLECMENKISCNVEGNRKDDAKVAVSDIFPGLEYQHRLL